MVNTISGSIQLPFLIIYYSGMDVWNAVTTELQKKSKQ